MPRAARQDFNVSRSGTVDVFVSLTSDSDAMDLTGWTYSMKVWDGDTLLMTLRNQAQPGGSGLGAVDDGRIEIYINNDDVANLPAVTSYDFILTNPGGDPQTYLSGYIRVRDA